jgi:hypothetical protein
MNKKVLLVASHGGHWVQMRKMSPAFDGQDVYYLTTTKGVETEVAHAPVYVVPDANLNEKLALIALAMKVFWVVVKIRPGIVMSTGAAPGFFALMFGKFVGARTIWVDSVANVEQLSVSGKKVRWFADLWLTQWPHLEQPDGPYYRGSVL